MTENFFSAPLSPLLHGMKLTTAEILYRMPDYPSLLQTFVWQDYDADPSFPILRKFLRFWENSLEGKLHSVTIASAEILRPREFIYSETELRVH
ncbi:MAG: hypothetical protein ABW189_02530 [Rickettsiales bacterium]